MNNTQAVNQELVDRLNVIAHSNYTAGFDVLKEIFEKRKFIANNVLHNKLDILIAEEYLYYYDKEIKKIFGIK